MHLACFSFNIVFVFQIGDAVRLKPEALADRKFIPAQLIQLGGFPNRFTVTRTETVEDADTGVFINAISLDECCGKLKDAKTGIPLCDSHPVSLFELVQRSGHDPEWMENAVPDRVASIDTPLGKLLQLAHIKRENGINTLVLKLPFGLGPISMTGPWADKGAEAAKDLGLL